MYMLDIRYEFSRQKCQYFQFLLIFSVKNYDIWRQNSNYSGDFYIKKLKKKISYIIFQSDF